MVNDDAASGIQLRKHPRLPVTFPLTFVVGDSTNIAEGKARDIGGGGIYLESDRSVAAKASVTLWFELRAGTKLEVHGRTTASYRDAATGKQQIRIAFEAIPDDVRDAILRYIFESWRAVLMQQI